MLIEVSNGEIVDKVTILELKKVNITDKDKLQNIIKEFEYLKSIMFKLNIGGDETYDKLFNVNKKLWEVEDLLRIKEGKKEFDEEFIELARKVYYLNDERAVIKKNINIKTKSNFVEEKHYEKY
jgi:hypothetical protein